jgi:MFS family permease
MVAPADGRQPVSGIIGGPLSGFILHHFAGSNGIAGWQWLFILEAIPAILFGAVIFFFLDNRVVDAKWLSEERASGGCRRDSRRSHNQVPRIHRVCLYSPKVWLLCAIFFGIEMGSYAVGFWQPTIIRQTGVKDAFTIGLLTTIPYAAALVALVLTGRHSDRTRERRWHAIFPCLAAAVGFVLCTQAGSNTPLAMFGLVLAAARRDYGGGDVLGAAHIHPWRQCRCRRHRVRQLHGQSRRLLQPNRSSASSRRTPARSTPACTSSPDA